MATAELGEHEAGVWALAADAHGQLLVTGTEDGYVAAIDARTRRTPWQVHCSPPFDKHPTPFSRIKKGLETDISSVLSA